METLYNKYLERFADESGDTENWHMRADIILCDIAISAAKQQLTLEEVEALIKIFNDHEKWYA